VRLAYTLIVYRHQNNQLWYTTYWLFNSCRHKLITNQLLIIGFLLLIIKRHNSINIIGIFIFVIITKYNGLVWKLFIHI